MEQMVDKKDAYKEVFVALSCFNNDILEKIPQNVLDKLIEVSADSSLEVKLDVNKGLEEQNLSEECKCIMALLYYKYIANDEEKKRIVQIWEFNDKIMNKL